MLIKNERNCPVNFFFMINEKRLVENFLLKYLVLAIKINILILISNSKITWTFFGIFFKIETLSAYTK